MERYQVDWPCCGDTSITDGYEPGSCPFCALTTHAGADGESVWLFKSEGKWLHFVSEDHRLNTIADGRWEVRQFFAAPPAPEALEVKRG